VAALSIAASPREISITYLRHMKPILFLLLISFLSSCSVTEKNIAGTYRLNTPSKTKLVLNKDKTFEFVKNFAGPGPVFFPDSTEMNFRTRGEWRLDQHHNLILNSFPPQPKHAAISNRDSVIHHASITSLSFWDSYGDPVPIRFIKFLPDKIKFYRGNTISFFREDFGKIDTLEFHFYGYAPVKWPSRTAEYYNYNHTRWFVLQEEERLGYFDEVILSAEKNKLISPDKTFALYKDGR
jgi:hypothetical protein